MNDGFRNGKYFQFFNSSVNKVLQQKMPPIFYLDAF